MDNQKLAVLVLRDVVVFPNNEVRIEYDDLFEKASIDYADSTEGKYLVIVNPIDSSLGKEVTSLPNYGVLGQLKLKLNVPNGKTRVVIEGIRRVEVTNYSFSSDFYQAEIHEVPYTQDLGDDKNYYTLLMKSLDKNRPVYVCGVDEESGDGHAWVASGYRCMTRKVKYYTVKDDRVVYSQTSYMPYIYVNAGYLGKSDGYYYSGVFSPWWGTYSVRVKMITNIRYNK